MTLKMARIWWNLTRALESLQNLHFHLLLLCKVFNVWPKKLQRSYLSWHWRMVQNLKRNWLVILKLAWGIWRSFTRALKSLKNFHFNLLLLSKVYIVWAEKVQKSYLSWNWRRIQSFRRNRLVVSKLT